ncbi:MAG: phospholipase effector Tle1 domain-containing protein [Flavobacterium sp.]
MNPIKKIQINRLSPINYEVEVHTDALMNEQVIIVKADFNYFFSKKANNQLHKAQISLNPAINVEPNIRIYLYNYLTDHVEEIRHEFIEMNPFLFPQVLDATYMMGGSDFFNRNWNRGLKALKIEGPFQNDAKVKKINPSQKVTFHASTNAQNADIAQIMSMQWHLIDEKKQEINIRKLKDFKIVANKERVTVSFYLNEMSSFTLHAHYSNFKEAILLFSNQNPESQNQKTKIHFTIGMFFDGTGNNMLNSDQVYYKNLDNKNLVKDSARQKQLMLSGKKNTKFKVATDSSYWNPYSNVALLHDLYKTEGLYLDEVDGMQKVTLKQYVQGIGTLEREQDDLWGSGFGANERGIIGKVREGCKDLTTQIKKYEEDYEIGSITFDVFGFSRGAAAARHFCNEILGSKNIVIDYGSTESSSSKNKTIEIDKTRVEKKNTRIPISQTFLLGILGDELKKAGIKFRFEDNFDNVKDNNLINIRFLGLFDTVVAQFIPKYYNDANLDILKEYKDLVRNEGYSEANIKISDLKIKRIIHLTAEDEWRDNFALTSVDEGVSIALIGAHSDIGGGYAADLKENCNLHKFAVKTGSLIENINNPIFAKKEIGIKNYFIKKGFCNEREIKFKKIGETSVELNNMTNIIDGVIFKLVSSRIVKPRYSTVPLFVMKNLAEISGVNFLENSDKSIVDDDKYKSHSFEYEIPKELSEYYKIILALAKEKYNEVYKKESKQSLPMNKRVSESLKIKIRHDFIHLSANFDKQAFPLPKLVNTYTRNVKFDIGEVDFINKIAFVNHPRVTQNNSNPYEREILSE